MSLREVNDFCAYRSIWGLVGGGRAGRGTEKERRKNGKGKERLVSVYITN